MTKVVRTPGGNYIPKDEEDYQRMLHPWKYRWNKVKELLGL